MLERKAEHPTLINHPNISMDGYKVLKHLGEGGFGQVVLAQARTTKQVSSHVPIISAVAVVS
jgi:serine/threonine protein kinase